MDLPMTQLLPPPAEPREVPTAETERAVARQLGLELPEDYLAFFRRYGSGEIRYVYEGDEPRATHIRLYNPGSPFYLPCVEMDCGMIRELQVNDRTGPFAVHPERPGLLPWGMDIDGNAFFWWTNGSREDWPVIFLSNGALMGEYERFDMTFTAFLDKLLRREIVVKNWIDNDADYFRHTDCIQYHVAPASPGG